MDTTPQAGRPAEFIGLLLKGRYKVVRRLGSGGFATVFEARDEDLLSRRVVVKVLHTAKIDDWLLRKFRQEKEALVRINDPGVVAILDEGKTPEDTPFLVMEYVDGVTLRHLVQPGGMELARAAEIFRQIGSALEAAHHEGVLHRDLKPENIMMQSSTAGDRVRLIDFGIAGIADSVYHSDSQSTRIAGTLWYMPPEQHSGEVSAQTDIYAFGVLAFELLTGEHAVKSPMQLVTLSAGALEARLRELRPDVPEAAAKIVSKALSGDPKLRHASALEMGTLLRDALVAPASEPVRPVADRQAVTLVPPEVGKPAPPKPNITRRLAAVGAIALVAGGAWFVYQKMKPPPPPPPPPAVTLHLDYFATVQKFKDGQPEGKPVEYANASVLPAGYGIAISSSSPEAGYLYIVNDGPLPDGSQSINVLFPAYHAPAEIGAGQTIRIPQEQWNVLDEASGTESLYLVWSGEPVPELERAKDQTDALTNEGIVIRDSTQIAELRQLLAKYRVPEAQIRADESAHRTSLTSQKDVLVHLIQLKHL